MPRPRRTVSVHVPTHELLAHLAREDGEPMGLVVARLILREAQRRNRHAERRRQREADATAETERQRIAPRLRVFRYDFPAGWTYLHIPAIEHGFQTNALGIEVFLNILECPRRYWTYDFDLTASYTVKIALRIHGDVVALPGETVTTLCGYNGGTVVLSGMVPPETVSPAPDHAVLATSD